MNPNDAVSFIVAGISHAHLHQHYTQLSHWGRNHVAADHGKRGRVSSHIEMAIEAVRRTRGHWQGADEIHEGELVQRYVTRALPRFSLRRFPSFLIGEKVDGFVMTGERIPLVFEEAERRAP